ncbi:MAG: arginine--tRNA ligase [Candidatus Aenigmatarchaeota archaeon]
MKTALSSIIAKSTGLPCEVILASLERPPTKYKGDIAFPCFTLAKGLKKSPTVIAKNLADSIAQFPEVYAVLDKIEAVGGYVNFHFNKEKFSEVILKEIFEAGDHYGTNKSGKNKKVIIEMSSPNIAKPFGIGHLRSTIIGESLSRIYKANGYKVIKINYLGDWGTQFGKLIYGLSKWGNEKKLKSNPIDYLQELYVKTHLEIDEGIENASRNYFKLMEEGDEGILRLWRKIKKYSISEFEKIYDLLNISFDVVEGESEYNESAQQFVTILLRKGIARKSEGSIIVDLQKEGKSVAILRKSDGTTTYLARDIAAAINRRKKYEFDSMIYEVGAEQKLHFEQLFAILEKMGYQWSHKLKHVSHGLYLGKDGKKLSTRQGTNVKIKDIWDYAFNKVIYEMQKRQNSPFGEDEKERAKKITRAALIYTDLGSYRENNIKYDLDSMISTEGNTGPYLLYSYARSKSILKKLKYQKPQKIFLIKPTNEEYLLISKFSEYPEIVQEAKNNDDPSLIAKYSIELANEFNSFYEKYRIYGSDREAYRAQLVNFYSSILKNALNLIGIETIEKI